MWRDWMTFVHSIFKAGRTCRSTRQSVYKRHCTENSGTFLKRITPVPRVQLHRIAQDQFVIGDATWWPLPVVHHSLPVLGFRIGGLAYITDANQLSELALKRLEGVDVLVLNALRRESHLSHFTLEEALEWASKLVPPNLLHPHQPPTGLA